MYHHMLPLLRFILFIQLHGKLQLRNLMVSIIVLPEMPYAQSLFFFFNLLFLNSFGSLSFI